MPKAKPSEIVGKIVDLLTPLSPDDRGRVIAASQALLGDSESIIDDPRATGRRQVKSGVLVSTTGKAGAWQKQNGIDDDQLGQVFHTADGKTDVIAGEMPGKNKKEQSLNAYVLRGLANLLAEGEPKFTDKDARALCMSAGCYDSANHAATLKDKGNWFTGSKDKGWTVTAPGLKHGATLVKALSSKQE